MAVGYRSSSTAGNDAQATSKSASVPSGAAADDVMVAFLHRWETGGPTGSVTGPSGFTRFGTTYASGDGNSVAEIWWKRLTGSDGGTYQWTWSGSYWSSVHVICMTGAVLSGDPIGTPNGWAGTAGTFGTTTVSTSDPCGCLWHAYNDTSADNNHTPPTGFTEIIDDDCTTSAYIIQTVPGSQQAANGSVTTSSPSLAILVAVLPEDAPDREALDITDLGGTTWVTGTTSVSPTYPASLQEGDVCYILVHNRESGAIPTTPSNWTQVGTSSIGSGTVAAGTGPTRATILKRVVPAGGLSGSQAVTITGATVSTATMMAFRPSRVDATLAWEEVYTAASSTASSTPTTSPAVSASQITAKDFLIWQVGVCDDTATAITNTSVSCTGATFGTVVRAPNATVISGTGNDIATAAFYAPVTGGPNSGTTVAVASNITASETSGVTLARIRATAEVVATSPLVIPRRRGPNYRR